MSTPIERLQIVRGKNGRLEIRKSAPKTEMIKMGARDERVRPVLQAGKRR